MSVKKKTVLLALMLAGVMGLSGCKNNKKKFYIIKKKKTKKKKKK